MLRFEWDEKKDRSNEAKHGLSFEAVIPVFEDPGALFEPNCTVDGEERLQIIGLVEETMIYVVFTMRGEDPDHETYRLITARKASKGECKRYAEAAK